MTQALTGGILDPNMLVATFGLLGLLAAGMIQNRSELGNVI